MGRASFPLSYTRESPASIAEKKRDFASSGFTIRPKGGILYPYHSKIQEETMDIRQLHYFLVLCEEMNYTRAAQRLFLSR